MPQPNCTYLDWAATAPLCREAYDAMNALLQPWPSCGAGSFNANSLHSDGRLAFSAMEQARRDTAAALDARPDEITFTGGATEADYMAVVGLAHAMRDKRIRSGQGSAGPWKVVTTTIEHDAVTKACDALAQEGFEIIRLAPEPNGIISVESIDRALDADTILVTMMAVNNEIGSVQPIEYLTKKAHALGTLVHTDAVQMVGKLPFSCHKSGVDAASISAHKVGGPKGVGVLYLKAGTPFSPVIEGGGQEHGLRGGTQNVAGMAGCAAALKVACADETLSQERMRLQVLRDCLYSRLCALPGVHASVPCESESDAYVPTIVNVCVDDVETETLILQLDDRGFSVSGGSACSSHSLEPSHVLLEIGIPYDRALGSLRVSMGRFTTEDDINAFIDACTQVITSLKGGR